MGVSQLGAHDELSYAINLPERVADSTYFGVGQLGTHQRSVSGNAGTVAASFSPY